jgi:hypothetical protein
MTNYFLELKLNGETINIDDAQILIEYDDNQVWCTLREALNIPVKLSKRNPYEEDPFDNLLWEMTLKPTKKVIDYVNKYCDTSQLARFIYLTLDAIESREEVNSQASIAVIERYKVMIQKCIDLKSELDVYYIGEQYYDYHRNPTLESIDNHYLTDPIFEIDNRLFTVNSGFNDIDDVVNILATFIANHAHALMGDMGSYQ